MNQTHTPGTWHTSHFFLDPPGVPQWHIYTTTPGGGAYIAVTCGNADAETREANAERIVLCCNAHDDLVAALKAFFEASWDALGDLYGSRFSIDDNDMSDRARIIRAYVSASDKIRSALAKAGEK